MSQSEAFAGIAACLFDAYGTLFDVHAPVRRLAGRIDGDAEALGALWRQKQVQYTWLRSLMGAYTGFETVTAEALDHALAVHGIADDELRGDLLAAYREIDAYPEVPASLAHLRQAGMPVGVLSNGERGAVRAAAAHAGFAENLDTVLGADAVAVFKPDARVYQLGPDALDLPAHRIAFVSANPWDVAGAAHFGYTVIWVNRFAQTRENLPGKPTGICARVDVVPALLGLGRPAGLDAAGNPV